MRIIIADAAVSLAPSSWKSDRKVSKYFEKYGRMPIVDGSKHQHLLQDIPLEERLDRPDILHFGLLTLLGYTRYLSNTEIMFSTEADYFSIDPDTRLPRSQKRFYGILEQLLSDSYRGSHFQRIDPPDLSSSRSIIFSPQGKLITNEDLSANNFVFGGFARNDFKTTFPSSASIVSLSDNELELWTAISIFINRYLDFHEYKI